MKKYLRIITFTLLLFAGVGAAFANHKHDDGKKGEISKEIKEFKVKFIAQEIDLSADKQKQFQELYKSYSEEKHEVFSQIVKLERKIKNDKNASEADYENLKNAMTAARAKDAAIEKKYDEKFASILSQKQIYLMKKAEMKFHDRMKEMHKEKRQKKSTQKK